MKSLIVAVIVAAIGIVVWRMVTRAEDSSGALDRLRSSIDASSLPDRAKLEMSSLVDQGRLRPSQYVDSPR